MDFQLTDEQKLLVSTIRDFAKNELADIAFPEVDTPDLMKLRISKLAQQGFLGLSIPEEYGGGGLSLLDCCLAIEEMGRHCPRSAELMLNTSIAQADFIQALGSEEHKAKYLPKICRGELFVSIAISEPEAGSAATDLRTTAELDGNEYVLNGSKQFISMADLADVFVVYALFDKAARARGIGAILVEKGTPGFSLGKPEINMAGDAQFQLFFEDCRVPALNVLITGNAFGALMEVYNAERLGAIARTLGIAQGALDRAIKYSQERKQFNRELCDFQGIQWKLADMAAKLEASRYVLYRAACNARNGLPSEYETSVAKLVTMQAAKEVCDEAIQIFGGYGYLSEFPVEYLYRRVRGYLIAGGTMEIHRNIVASKVLGRKISQWKK
ncbi:MAG: acyl-CoA dehydrogenase family protein [Bacillota bacterium]